MHRGAVGSAQLAATEAGTVPVMPNAAASATDTAPIAAAALYVFFSIFLFPPLFFEK